MFCVHTCASWSKIPCLPAPTLSFAIPLDSGAGGDKCVEFRLLDVACLVVPNRPLLFWEKEIALLLMDAVGLLLLEEYCVSTRYMRWYVIVCIVLCLNAMSGLHK